MSVDFNYVFQTNSAGALLDSAGVGIKSKSSLKFQGSDKHQKLGKTSKTDTDVTNY